MMVSIYRLRRLTEESRVTTDRLEMVNRRRMTSRMVATPCACSGNRSATVLDSIHVTTRVAQLNFVASGIFDYMSIQHFSQCSHS
jgi:hypothetical protein